MKLNDQELLASLPLQVVHHIQRLERIRQDFVANVSHELRTPLTVVHGYLEILLEQPDLNPELEKIFSQMYQQTLRMENLIENLLLLLRLEGQGVQDKIEQPVKVAEMLTLICNEAKEVSNAQHSIELHADPKLLLKGYSDELYSVFSNIIFNAVKYTPPNGVITVSWYKKNKKAYFTVQDTGIGIAEEHIPRLTERFYCIDPARSRASGGTGLGLAIVKHALLRHNAELQIQSEIGKGSIFTCIFPVA